MSLLGVKLQAIKSARIIRHTGDRCVVRGGDDLETLGQGTDVIAMAHPDVQHAVAFVIGHVLDDLQQFGMAPGTHLRVTKFSHVRGLELTAQFMGHALHAIADTEDGDHQFEDAFGWANLIRQFDEFGAYGQDQAF